MNYYFREVCFSLKVQWKWKLSYRYHEVLFGISVIIDRPILKVTDCIKKMLLSHCLYTYNNSLVVTVTVLVDTENTGVISKHIMFRQIKATRIIDTVSMTHQ